MFQLRNRKSSSVQSVAAESAIASPSSGILREFQLTLLIEGLVLLLVGALVAELVLSTNPVPYAWVAAGLGVCVAIAAGLRLRRKLDLTSRLYGQLSRLAEDPKNPNGNLHPIVDRSKPAKGWNLLVEAFARIQSEKAVERRLESAPTQTGSERFARALRSMPEGMAITDAEGNVSYVNAAWANTLGTQIDTRSSIPCLVEMLASAEFKNWDSVENRLLEGTRPNKWELDLGATVHDGVLRLERTPMEGREGEEAGFVWTLRDITQTALAREAHEQFLSSATHELRTPLTNIRGYSESLIEVDLPPEEQKSFVNVIHSEAGRLGRLLNQLLDIQQLEAGSMTVNIDRFEVQRMIHEVKEHIDPLIKEKKLNFTARIAPDIKTIDADKEKMTSCLVNLLGNAIKYTPDGGDVRLFAEQSDGFLNIAVEDTGIGIEESEISKIFDRFYRCNDERVAELEGNGLGLAFSQEVVRLHNGELQVDSQINVGSRFTISLPLASEDH
ncbi:MAG: hypothetical protein Aurels2KO_13820 [Aureliella sp.]